MKLRAVYTHVFPVTKEISVRRNIGLFEFYLIFPYVFLKLRELNGAMTTMQKLIFLNLVFRLLRLEIFINTYA